MYAVGCQKKAPWHLNTINGNPREWESYAYDDNQPATKVYVVDSWMDVDHPDFEKRASRGPAFQQGTNSGHGTHVGGLIGSKTFGVNKNAQLISVQVLNGDG